jgi:hypothetical protein
MSTVNNGPQIVRSGLILNLDAGNKKSYSTNRFQSLGSGLITENVTFPINGTGTFQRVAAGTVIGGYTVRPNDVVYSYTLGVNGCHYHGNSAPVIAGSYATFSFDYLVTGATNYPSTDYLANFEGVANGSIGIANTLQNVWQRRSFTVGPISTSGNLNMYLYPGACGATRLADAGTIYYRNPKVELTNIDTGNNTFSATSNIGLWYDLSGNTNNGTLTNGPTSNVSNKGNILFDTNYIALPTSGLAFGTGTFTIEAWVNLSSSTTNNIIYCSQSSNVSGFIGLVYASGTGFQLTDFNGSTRVTTTNTASLLIGNWYHVVGIRNASNQYVVYINTVASTTNNSSTLSLATADPRIGINPATNTEKWVGKIAMFRMYNRALSQTEISQNYEAAKTKFGL